MKGPSTRFPVRDRSQLTDLRAVFQPVVDLDRGAVVGYEALARGRAGSPLESPLAMFAAARAEGRLAELDLACQAVALDAAEQAGWSGPQSLFLNVEPELIDKAAEPARMAVIERARELGPVVIELTERALTAQPAELLRGVDKLRELGCLIALDDVGADDRSLALMPFLRPDVIKLDLRLVQARPTDEIAAVIHAVMAESDRSGAAIVAEGVETDAHLETALAFGATLAQGYRFGRPGPLAFDGLRGDLGIAAPTVGAPAAPSPFDLIIATRTPVRRARKGLLIRLARQLEEQAASLGDQAVLLATFEHARYFDGDVQHRYSRIAEHAAFVVAFGEEMGAEPAAGVRGQVLSADEALHMSWDVAVVAPHFAAALVSRDLGDPRHPDLERRFDFCVVYERPLALAAARLLMSRVQAAPG